MRCREDERVQQGEPESAGELHDARGARESSSGGGVASHPPARPLHLAPQGPRQELEQASEDATAAPLREIHGPAAPAVLLEVPVQGPDEERPVYPPWGLAVFLVVILVFYLAVFQGGVAMDPRQWG